MTSESYVHLVGEDVDKTVCNLDLFDSESGGAVEAKRTGDQGVSRR